MKLAINDFKVRSFNSSPTYYTGSMWDTTNCGKVTVIAQLDEYFLNKNCCKCYGKFIVQFEDGTYVTAWNSTLGNGKIRNPYRPSLFDRGFVGQGEWFCRIDYKLTKEYSLWAHMLRRCYDEKFHKEFPTYKDCEVDERWWNFQLFCEDIQYLDGYLEWIKEGSTYQLDKDICVSGNKLYSKDTCMFVTPKENTTESNQRNNITGKTYVATRLSDGHEELFYNISEFARKYKMPASNIGHILSKTQKRYTCHGWKFDEYKGK